MRLTISCAVAIAALTALPALAGGSHTGGHSHDDGFAFGRPGEAPHATRTIRVVMTDNAYDPGVIEVAAGETVRFVAENRGDFVHEFGLGTPAMHAEHRKEMLAMMESGMLEADRIHHGMGHDDPNSLLLEPGESGEIIWTFAGPIRIEFACNVPGHYESGMVGPLVVTGTGS
ncbi:Uncharacterized copper-binding protein, cupredoxin-like subfamily [Meinhardsimonia xiamenensis]|jgi:uncharacterized cupredoxin-like copper-binding protein|uniref:Uncharacterized copper-binding protein, cupredoxin-like subfamily n=1 Tax=Meinhardsimonia xiamenensis TaxID=990712 RepID=A0A1G9CVN2_9RHOB|nr:cupredoxin family protein [Meinhardsimonia xiamenensis]PRX38229.1 putative cupredoxin-like copper-binding protein [Meinhardsimonia xiamenensis]SDK55701.1 Uncharacterized copper-binding protein, cupredoxin-like subfamily [Meinhardsimonia xiamenensis]